MGFIFLMIECPSGFALNDYAYITATSVLPLELKASVGHRHSVTMLLSDNIGNSEIKARWQGKRKWLFQTVFGLHTVCDKTGN